ncbi:helix-turn-helix domain-containing protein [Riemerella anatipestifer]|uniref:helix-turn-helix domain-containing protein n=1 Tax=Riemerella anatipestifer TaxID=34085 RepID=UPI003DAA38A9
MAKKELNREDKKAVALDLFLDTDKTQKEIAEIVGVTEKTLTKWKLEGEWDKIKSASTITARNIIDNIYQKMHELSQSDKLEADKLIKLASTIEKLSDKKVTISQIINVFKDFTTWAFGEDPELAKQINLLQKKYVNHKIGS